MYVTNSARFAVFEVKIDCSFFVQNINKYFITIDILIGSK